jgi:small nuclear ribonucleoprotein (snRNP)-like protein
MKRLFLTACAIVAAFISTAFGQVKVELQQGDTMKTVLERHVGQAVDLRMKSGEKLGGKLEKVTDKLAHLSQLTGAEFFDGVVDIDAIAAVAVRTKAK